MAIASFRPSQFRPAAAYLMGAGAAPALPAAAPLPPSRPTDVLALSTTAPAPTGGAPTFDDLETDESLPLPADEPIGGAVTGVPVVRKGSSGPAVRTLQEKLQAAGFDCGGADGDFGARTEAAVKAFQQAKGLPADGVAGDRTWGALGMTTTVDRTPNADAGLRNRLLAGLKNAFKGVRHQCFRFAWATVAKAGGKSIGSAVQSHAGRGTGVANLDTLVRTGQVKVGDVIYVNKVPGADPSSSNLKYGPHWMVYLGNGMFGDQYGVRGAQAMAAFVPGRKIDTIYHTA
jgi:peptidoglycan hydrolase-like protein with peptidoglycan-binding domain